MPDQLEEQLEKNKDSQDAFNKILDWQSMYT
jgi:hypothetical protein